MEKLLNHHPICTMLYTGNYYGALKLFEDTFHEFKKEISFSQYKLFVVSLNFAIYNYILMKENISLHSCCMENHEKIQETLEPNSLMNLGKELITQYAMCTDYRFEKFTNPEIKKAIQYIHAHMDEPLTLETVCEAIHLNKCYFCTLFKQDTGFTFTQYLNQIRIHQAKHLMIDTKLSLYDIAFCCGFNNYSYFCTTFKKIVGQSPSSFPRKSSVN
nr:AraC family transcriptional regulator [uncultured Niameybacter sp.]